MPWQGRQQAAEPGVAGAGRVDDLDLARGDGDGMMAVVEVASLGVQLDADQAGLHLLAERGDFRRVRFAGE